MYLHGKSVTLPTPAAPLRLQQDEKLGAITRTPRHGQCFLHRRAKSGSVVHIATPDSSALKFAQVRFQLAIHYPQAETVDLVRMTQIINAQQPAEAVAEPGGGVTIECVPRHRAYRTLRTSGRYQIPRRNAPGSHGPHPNAAPDRRRA